MVAGILPPTEGSLAFDGKPVWRDGRVAAKETALAMQMIFQDSFALFDPRLRVEEIIGEAPRVNGLVTRREAAASLTATSTRARPAHARRGESRGGKKCARKCTN